MRARYLLAALALFGCSGNAFSVSEADGAPDSLTLRSGDAHTEGSDSGALSPSDARGAPESRPKVAPEAFDAAPLLAADSGAPRAPDAAPSGTGGAMALGAGGATGSGGAVAGTGGAPPLVACADRSPELCPLDPACKGRAPCCTIVQRECGCVALDGVCR